MFKVCDQMTTLNLLIVAYFPVTIEDTLLWIGWIEIEVGHNWLQANLQLKEYMNWRQVSPSLRSSQLDITGCKLINSSEGL